MKILVTGSHGQLGNDITGISKTWPSSEFLFTDSDLLDITNEKDIQNYLQKNKPHFIINCAAYTAVDKAESEIEIAEQINAFAPGILARNACKIGAKLIHISTDYVFDGIGHLPYSEENKVDPQNAYGRTKLQGEINALRENPETIVIRTSWLYSAFGNNFVKTMMRLGKERESLKVVFDQVGTPTYAGDLANAIIRIVQRSAEDSKQFLSGIYHYSNEGVASWYDFAKAIFEISGIECEVYPVLSDEFPTPAQRPNFSVLNKSKIKNTFEIEIPYWKDSLKICIEKLKNN